MKILPKEELLKFWKSTSGSRDFLRILQLCEIEHFFTICLISLQKLIGSSQTFYHRCILGQRSLC